MTTKIKQGELKRYKDFLRKVLRTDFIIVKTKNQYTKSIDNIITQKEFKRKLKRLDSMSLDEVNKILKILSNRNKYKIKWKCKHCGKIKVETEKGMRYI